MKKYKTLMIAVFSVFTIAISQQASAQQTILEDDVSFNILKWHFHHYPQSTTSQWYALGEGLLKVECVFGNNQISVLYNPKGNRLTEEVDMTKSLPVSIEYLLDEKYEKYKIQDFIKVTNFESEMIIYNLTVKTKERGVINMKFDEHFVAIDDNMLVDN